MRNSTLSLISILFLVTSCESSNDGFQLSQINQRPKANDDFVITTNSSEIIVNVLKNDNDPDNDHVFITEISHVNYGTIELKNGLIIYRPESSSFTGKIIFQYFISDSQLTDSALVTLTINARK